MSGCSDCSYSDDCAPYEKQLCENGLICDYFEFIDNYCLEDESEWKEFSYNKYTETLWDYGEMSEWELYISRKH